MTAARYNCLNAQKRLPWIGRFYEALIKQLTRSNPLPESEGHMDLVIPRIATCLEVKAGDNNRRLRIFADQLEAHTEDVGDTFPAVFDYLVYFICCYKNRTGRGNGLRKSLLGRCRDETDVYAHLATATDTIYAFDHRVLLAIKDVCGVSIGKFPGQAQSRPTIELGRRFLRSFNEENASKILSDLNLVPDAWGIRQRYVFMTVHIGLFKEVLPLRVIEVLPVELFAEFDAVTRVPTRRVPSRRTMRLALLEEPKLKRRPAKVAV